QIPCPHATCNQLFKTLSGLKHHQSSTHNYTFQLSPPNSAFPLHSTPAQPAPGVICDHHDKLTGELICI
ncbi:hypothetical protein PAXRUDRAFT_152304, partial [Paxillus rubicundulus Ve08.2h10]